MTPARSEATTGQPRLPCIFPCFRCADAAVMIDWLVDVFGFRVDAKFVSGDGVVEHAQLALGPSLVMLGDARSEEYGRMLGTAGDAGGKSIYIAVGDVDAVYGRALAAGTSIESPPGNRAYGSREFVCRDPEGNVWSIGSYWPSAGVTENQCDDPAGPRSSALAQP